MTDNNGAGAKQVSSPSKKKGMGFALSALIVGLGLIITKCSGLLRDIIVSMRFSEDLFRDGFTLAFTIPDLFYNLLVGGAIYSTVAPYMSAQLAVGKEKQGVRTVSIFISVVCVVMLVCCAFGSIFSEPIYALYALNNDKIDPQVLSLAAQASKMLFPQIFFIMLAALCNGILNSYRKFTITSFGPVLYNILVLVVIYIFAGNSLTKLVMTTGGILVSAVIYFVFQYSLGFKQMKQFRFIFKPADKEFLMLFRRAIPILISASITQINVVVLNHFALMFDQGSVYGFRNASTIWQIPYSVFVVAITTVMTPELAGDYESKKYSKASDLVSSSMKSALFMTIPSAVFIAVLNLDVVKAIYQWTSAYTDRNAQTAATFLLGFCSAIITATVIHVFNQAFYAIGQTKLPLAAGILGLVINPVACQIMVSLGVGPLSLSLAYSFTNVCQMIMLAVAYCRRKELAPHGIIGFLLKSAVCAVVMAGVVYVVDMFVPAQGGKFIQLAIIATKGIVAVVVFFAMAVILRMKEATYWIERFKRLFKKRSSVKG
ncbi:MAG: murein biosynthesis integral membrane protein MurJ [Saccharofermentans sp.]|jgi:putative peptidoglycan lipid II flippase|nr:murein biosynthesis integral membrane protein MurJ [Saccharofermentans sp.]